MALFNKKEISSSAEVVDKHLILSLPNAKEPVVWRMALDKIGTASFEIKETKTDGVYNLVLKPQKGTVETIAPFNNKDEALNALIQASNALQRPEKMNIISRNDNEKISFTPSKENNKWLWLFLGTAVVIGLYIYMINQIPNKVSDFGNNQLTQSGDTPQSETGVPLSADDFLNGM